MSYDFLDDVSDALAVATINALRRAEDVPRRRLAFASQMQLTVPGSPAVIDLALSDLWDRVLVTRLGETKPKVLYPLRDFFHNLQRGRQVLIRLQLPGHLLVEQRVSASPVASGGSLAGLLKIKKYYVQSDSSQTLLDSSVYKFDDQEKLRDEVLWLQSLPQEAADHFPQVLDSQLDRAPYFYKMPCYPYKSVRELVFSGQLDYAGLIPVLSTVFGFLAQRIYSRDWDRTGNEFLAEIHLNRFFQRVDQGDNLLRKVVKLTPVINGKEMRRPVDVLQNIAAKHPTVPNILVPGRKVDIHGDAHLGNILFEPASGHFILVDPRGFLNGCDYAYDFGKLLHSVDGHDCVKECRSFDIEGVLDDWIAGDRLVFNFTIPSASADPLVARAQAALSAVGDQLPTMLASHVHAGDDTWWLRSKFAEAVHFLSVWPFFQGRPEQQLLMYSLGCESLNEIASSVL